MREEPGARESARDRARGRFDLHDLLAGRTGALRPHMPDHLEVARHVLEDFGDILTQAFRLGPALGALDGGCVHERLAQ